MSVLHGRMVVSKEEETGIMYRGEFYPPIDLALEAYDYLVDGSVETALGILDLIEDCIEEDYPQGDGRLISSILYEGMVGLIERRFARRIEKMRKLR